MSFANIRPAIQSVLDGIADFEVVYNYPRVPEEFPAATIMLSEAPSDYETNMENQRVYAFNVRVYYETKVGGVSNAVDALEGLVDDVVDAFDQDDLLTGAGLSLPARYTMIQLVPTPSAWQYFLDQNYIVAEIRIQAIVSVDIT